MTSINTASDVLKIAGIDSLLKRNLTKRNPVASLKLIQIHAHLKIVIIILILFI